MAKVSFRKTVNQSKEPSGNTENFNFPQYQTQLSQIYLSHFLSFQRCTFKRMQHLIFLNAKRIFLGITYLSHSRNLSQYIFVTFRCFDVRGGAPSVSAYFFGGSLEEKMTRVYLAQSWTAPASASIVVPKRRLMQSRWSISGRQSRRRHRVPVRSCVHINLFFVSCMA